MRTSQADWLGWANRPGVGPVYRRSVRERVRTNPPAAGSGTIPPRAANAAGVISPFGRFRGTPSLANGLLLIILDRRLTNAASARSRSFYDEHGAGRQFDEPVVGAPDETVIQRRMPSEADHEKVESSIACEINDGLYPLARHQMTLDCQSLQGCQLFRLFDARYQLTICPFQLELDLADTPRKRRDLRDAEHVELGVGLTRKFERRRQGLECAIRTVIGHEDLVVDPTVRLDFLIG